MAKMHFQAPGNKSIKSVKVPSLRFKNVFIISAILNVLLIGFIVLKFL